MISTLYRPAEWLLDVLGVGKTTVNARSMNSIPAVWYALQKISGDVGKMPLEPRLAKADGRGSDKLMTHPTWGLLRDEPNDYQTSDVFKQLIQTHALGWGNGRAWINRSGTRPTELIPLLPDRTDTLMVQGVKYHATCPDIDDPLLFREVLEETDATGRIPDEMIVLPDADVFHIVGMGFDGVKGWNIGRVFEDVLSAGRGAHRHVRKQSEKGFTGKIMLSDAGGAFSGRDAQKEAETFLKQFREHYTSEGDGEIAGMLRRGMTAEVLTMSNADAQLIEQMRFNRQDVMLIFGLSHIPGDDTATSYNSLEQQQLQYLASTLDLWLVRWESQCWSKLLTAREKFDNRIYFKFNTASWLKTDAQTTANVLATHIRSTVLNPNEAREMLDRNPRDGGDDFQNPAIQVKPNETDATKSDQARNKLRELASVEAKRIVEIVGKKSLADSDAAIRSFYDRFKVTLNREMSELDAAFDVEWYVDNRMDEIATIAVESKTVKAFRESVQKTVLKWSE